MKPRLLDLFCGVGGWSKSFAARGWHCVGVHIAALGYPYEFVCADVLTLERAWLDGFDAIVASPPCEEFARAWLPWLRMDKTPAPWAVELLHWSIALCDRPRRLVECSNFSAHHAGGSTRIASYRLWGDVPLLFPAVPRTKAAKSGKRPDLRAEIPAALADTVADHFTAQIQTEALAV